MQQQSQQNLAPIQSEAQRELYRRLREFFKAVHQRPKTAHRYVKNSNK